MRKLLVVLLLSGCAQPQPTESQRALIAYWRTLCEKQGAAGQALEGCVMSHAMKFNADYRRTRTGDLIPQTNCTSQPDGLGGYRTLCY